MSTERDDVAYGIMVLGAVVAVGAGGAWGWPYAFLAFVAFIIGMPMLIGVLGGKK